MNKIILVLVTLLLSSGCSAQLRTGHTHGSAHEHRHHSGAHEHRQTATTPHKVVRLHIVPKVSTKRTTERTNEGVRRITTSKKVSVQKTRKRLELRRGKRAKAPKKRLALKNRKPEKTKKVRKDKSRKAKGAHPTQSRRNAAKEFVKKCRAKNSASKCRAEAKRQRMAKR